MTLKRTSVIKRAKERLSRCDSDKDSEVCNLIIMIILILMVCPSVCPLRKIGRNNLPQDIRSYVSGTCHEHHS